MPILQRTLLGLMVFCIAGWVGSAQAAAFKLKDREEWMGTYFQGKKLGFVHARTRVKERAIELESRVYLQLKTEGGDQTTSFTQETELAPSLKVVRFSLLQEIMGHRQKVDAREEKGRLVYRVTGPGFDKTQSLPFPPGSALSSTFLFNLMAEGLAVGREGTIDVLIEPFQLMSTLRYRVDRREDYNFQGESVPTFVLTYTLSGMESTLWVSEEGVVMRERTSQGFESVKEPEQVARDMGGERLSVSSVITLSLVKPARDISNPETLRKMKLRLTNLSSPGSIPEDHRQKILRSEKAADGSYRSTVEVHAEPLPLPGGAVRPVRSPGAGDWLGDSPEVQTRHPKIRRLASKLTSGTEDAWKAARAINRWVHSNLKKELVDATTALDALNGGRGECQSHTYLFTALARAAGIPTKIVNGLVYSSQYGGFLYHAWPEVYIGEWRALDPTFGQYQVDATHIKLSEGAEENPLRLMPFVGKVGIEVLEH
ncbi:MAG: transglutaminase domain-containing protein [Nitrospinaceae bacterium]|nr:MAG: transglutaminase domain-containing protein [Nitrospinaceae bacterium]